MLQGKSQLVTRWIQDEPLTLSNLILASRDEAAALKVCVVQGYDTREPHA